MVWSSTERARCCPQAGCGGGRRHRTGEVRAVARRLSPLRSPRPGRVSPAVVGTRPRSVPRYAAVGRRGEPVVQLLTRRTVSGTRRNRPQQATERTSGAATPNPTLKRGRSPPPGSHRNCERRAGRGAPHAWRGRSPGCAAGAGGGGPAFPYPVDAQSLPALAAGPGPPSEARLPGAGQLGVRLTTSSNIGHLTDARFFTIWHHLVHGHQTVDTRHG